MKVITVKKDRPLLQHIIYGFIFISLIFLWIFIGESWADDCCLECQKITFNFKNKEITVVDYKDLDNISIDEIHRAFTFFGAIRGSYGNEELKIEIYKRLCPNLYKRHIKE